LSVLTKRPSEMGRETYDDDHKPKTTTKMMSLPPRFQLLVAIGPIILITCGLMSFHYSKGQVVVMNKVCKGTTLMQINSTLLYLEIHGEHVIDLKNH
jgi:hypothetical protein